MSHLYGTQQHCTDSWCSGSSNIITHPRQIPSLVRRADDTRATKRAARAERKAAEKAAKEEEIRRLKGEKRREMEKQLESLKREVGDGVDWAEIERVLEGDFDEGQWERTLEKMMGAMGGEADGGDDDDDGDVSDLQQPLFSVLTGAE